MTNTEGIRRGDTVTVYIRQGATVMNGEDVEVRVPLHQALAIGGAA